MSPQARADDSHDGRYTHASSKVEPRDADAAVEYPKMLHGKPYVKEGAVISDKKVVHSKPEEDEEIESGAWKRSPKDWDSGFVRIGALFVAAVFALALGAVTLAQTALFTTTLGAQLLNPSQGNQQTTITLTSGTNVAVGQGLFVDREYMRILASTPQTTMWTVARGQDGTPATRHNSGATVWFGAPNLFEHSIRYSVGGSCVSTLTTAQPYINTQLAQISNCPVTSTLAGSPVAVWDSWFLGGNPNFQATRMSGYVYTTAGAIVIQSGVSQIGSAGVLAMTLANPAAYQDGLIMTIEASTAHAHTITPATGFFGVGSTACTLGGAIGDGLTIYAKGGVWWVLALHNCTIA